MENICCICERKFSEFPCGPFPFSGKICCTDCDDRFVTPARMLNIESENPLLNTLKFFAKTGTNLVNAKLMLHKQLNEEMENDNRSR